MRKLLIALLFLLSCGAIPGHAQVSGPGANDKCYAHLTSGSGGSCTITNQPGNGDLILCGGTIYLAPTSVTCSDGTNSFTAPTGTGVSPNGCSTGNTSSDRECLLYLIEPNGSGGKTFTITLNGATCSSPNDCTVMVARFPVTGGTVSFSSAIAGNGSGSTVNTPTISVSQANTFIAGFMGVAHTVTAVGGSWTALYINTAVGDGSEYQLSVSSSTALNATQNAGAWDSIGIAFLFTAGGASCTPTLTLLGAGRCG